jgi:preprotein translocase subunit YajC
MLNNFLPLTTTDAGGGNMILILVVYAVFIGVMYLVWIRPNNKKKKKEEALRKSAQVGDDITTIGGICGRIVAIKEDTDTLVVETGSDRSRIKIKRLAIASVDTIHDDPQA